MEAAHGVCANGRHLGQLADPLDLLAWPVAPVVSEQQRVIELGFREAAQVRLQYFRYFEPSSSSERFAIGNPELSPAIVEIADHSLDHLARTHAHEQRRHGGDCTGIAIIGQRVRNG